MTEDQVILTVHTSPLAFLPDSPTICPKCSSNISRTVPICPSCGKKLRGITIHCPSCKSSNVGINNGGKADNESERETMIFKPVVLPVDKHGTIEIPLVCRDCGREWEFDPEKISGP